MKIPTQKKNRKKRHLDWHKLAIVAGASAIIIMYLVNMVVARLEMCAREATRSGEKTPSASVEDAVAMPPASPGWQSEAREVLLAILNATTHEARLDHAHQPALVGHDCELAEPRAAPDFDPADFLRAELPASLRDDGVFLMVHPGRLQESAGVESMRTLAFFRHTANGLKLDWETFDQTHNGAFFSFINTTKPGASGVFRVFITAHPLDGMAGAPHHLVADIADIRSLAPAVVREDSEASRILSQQNFAEQPWNNQTMRTATLALRWSAPPDPPTLEITDFISWRLFGLTEEANPD